jgi:uncharacterized protein YndB with AHSA1/START domain
MSVKFEYISIIKATPETLWRALTDGTLTPDYYFGLRLTETDLKPDSPFDYLAPDGSVMCGGTVIECLPNQRLVTTFEGMENPEGVKDPDSRVAFEIQQEGPCCRLTLTHDGFTKENQTYANIRGGWPYILSGLKTLLETDRPLFGGEKSET